MSSLRVFQTVTKDQDQVTVYKSTQKETALHNAVKAEHQHFDDKGIKILTADMLSGSAATSQRGPVQARACREHVSAAPASALLCSPAALAAAAAVMWAAAAAAASCARAGALKGACSQMTNPEHNHDEAVTYLGACHSHISVARLFFGHMAAGMLRIPSLSPATLCRTHPHPGWFGFDTQKNVTVHLTAQTLQYTRTQEWRSAICT